MSGRYDALVVAGSPECDPALVAEMAPRCGAVVAVDRGADACAIAGVLPDLFVGDGDTVGERGAVWVADAPAVRLDPEKDDTDLSFALDRVVAICGPAARVALLGALGGRLDHLLGVLGVCRTHVGLAIDLIDRTTKAQLISPEGRASVAVPGAGTSFSVIPLADDTVVSERGARWDLDHAHLDALQDLGVSNRVARDEASVTCHAGCALVISQELSAPLAR